MTNMNWRNILLCGVLAAGLSLTFVPRASADPPPWAGRWHNRHNDGKHDNDWRRHSDHERWEHRDHNGRYGRDDDYWRRWRRDHDRYDHGNWNRNYGSYGRSGSPYYGNYSRYYGNYRNDPTYGKLTDRMANDQAKINEIEPTGRHRKALQWYKDDLRNAQRDMGNYATR
jgi:hypothetical protein